MWYWPVLFVATVWFTDEPIPTVTLAFSMGCPVEASVTVPLILPSKKGNSCPNTPPENNNDVQTKTPTKATKTKNGYSFLCL